ncbi:hypothetical protein BAUCODRAFT_557004 [Baudoinia panamericana UAMH 10762]|uniref:Uncharacterized protein n=1 Tax=Baudoinia panamericana (strain UAMH 10762) TaxID=717646 RepID=M2MDU0_BAUPA|nr:uncharacterized protein BAUCODRAFT_557004 [Baudoinia panamericana UAMH 10762]EMC94726.1 hypothetical protein BAUCODRAFT_557004 [Baudoinia panamericana UAMH 10762]
MGGKSYQVGEKSCHIAEKSYHKDENPTILMGKGRDRRLRHPTRMHLSAQQPRFPEIHRVAKTYPPSTISESNYRKSTCRTLNPKQDASHSLVGTVRRWTQGSYVATL